MPARRLIPPVAAALAGALWLALAWTRRLNFDESLALHAGWLDLAREPSRPAFLMPWTLFAGAVGHLVPDPGAVLKLLRVAVAAAVAWTFHGAARASGLGPAALAGAAWLLVANATFATHGLEFRYDAAVLVALLVAYRLLARGGSSWALGVCAGLLALHHLKGAFFALGVVAALALVAERRGRELARCAAGAAATWLAWAALLAPLGLVGRWGESLGEFFDLAAGSSRAPLGEALGPILRRDLAWWALVLVAVALSLGRREGEPRSRGETAALVFALLGVGFWIVHPHAWAYHVALPAPFLVLAATRALARGGRGLRAPLAAAGLGLVLQLASGAAPLLAHVPAAFAAPMAPEVELLRAVHAGLAPGDRALDPSGILYFVPPCTPEWYLDSLYAERLARGAWMRELAAGVPPGCTLALNTYRLTALPPPVRRQLGSEFTLLASGLAVRGTRQVPATWALLAGDGEVRSFW